jgi:adenylate cyclase class IV
MARETEIKLKITDVRALHRALKRIGARPFGRGSERVHEENVIFDTPQGGLAKHGQLLRIRTETPEARGKPKAKGSKQRVVMTFKQPIAERLEERPATWGEDHTRSGMRLKLRPATPAISRGSLKG